MLATLAILVVPGPSVMFVVARTLEHGRSAGLTSSGGGDGRAGPRGRRLGGPLGATQVAVLGVCFVAPATLTDGVSALLAARLSRGGRSRDAGRRRLARASAGTCGLLGVLAVAGGA